MSAHSLTGGRHISVLGMVAMLIVSFVLAPLIAVIGIAFTPTEYLSFPSVRSGLSLRWFRAVVDDPGFVRAFMKSLQLAVTASIAALVVGTAAALALVRHRFRGANIIEIITLSPLLLPSIVIGVSMLNYWAALGMRGSYLPLWLGHVVITVPYVVRTVMASLAGTNKDLELAAADLGASPLVRMRRVTLPTIRPGLTAGGLFAFLVSMDNVTVSLFLVTPRDRTFPVALYQLSRFELGPIVAALSVMLLAVTVVVIVVMERLLGLGNVMSSVKK